MVKGVLSRGKVSLLTAMVALLPAGLWQNGILAQTPMNARNEIHLVKSRVFNIPVHIEKSKTKEVTLYMRDGPPPAPWVKVETVFPTAEWFKCQVPHDGEFSFLVVTTDLYNRPSVTDINRGAGHDDPGGHDHTSCRAPNKSVRRLHSRPTPMRRRNRSLALPRAAGRTRCPTALPIIRLFLRRRTICRRARPPREARPSFPEANRLPPCRAICPPFCRAIPRPCRTTVRA